MERINHKVLLASIRATREEVLREVADLDQDEQALPGLAGPAAPDPGAGERRAQAHKALLRFGDHMRQHANQVEAARAALGRVPTSAERTLQEAELAWGKLLAAMTNLSDADCRCVPPDGEWSIEEILQHILAIERRSLEVIRAARRLPSK